MSLFVCERCQSIDNTSTAGRYHTCWILGNPLLCGLCDHGTWHGLFPRREYQLALHGPIGPGRLIDPDDHTRYASHPAAAPP